MNNYLEVKNLSKSFDNFRLHDIAFTLPKGYIMGLIGPNGSGKTTTIKLILNMLKRTDGEVKILGLDNIADEQAAKKSLGVVLIPTISVMTGKYHRLRNQCRFSMRTGTRKGFLNCWINSIFRLRKK